MPYNVQCGNTGFLITYQSIKLTHQAQAEIFYSTNKSTFNILSRVFLYPVNQERNNFDIKMYYLILII